MKLLKHLFILVLTGAALMAQAENIEINGTVTNESNSEPVAGQTIYFVPFGVEDTITTTTNEQGLFSKTIDLNTQDSIFVYVFTVDLCTGKMIFDYAFPDNSEYMIEFYVCGDSIPTDECMALFDYYSGAVFDSVGNSDTDSTTDNLTVFFIDYSFGNPTNWSWNFGDGETSTEQNPQHTYAETGDYDVTLTISSDDCENSLTQTVKLIDYYLNCQALFNYEYNYGNDSTNVDSTGNDELTILFYDYSIGNPDTWVWNFGDGKTSAEQNPVHTYSSKGEYNVTLEISNDSCSSSIQLSVMVGNYFPECEAYFGYDYENWQDSMISDPTNEDMLTLYFYDFSYGNIENWNWDFGDGETSTEQNPVHTYADSGEFIVNLTISGDECESDFSMPVYTGTNSFDSIWLPEECLAMFYPMVQENNTVEFINESYGEITDYNWDFGDNNTSIEPNPTHTYATKGEYMVSLTVVSGDACTSLFEMMIWVDDYVCDSALSALFIPEFDGTKVTFHNESKGEIWNTHWDFGDDNTSKVKNPVHIYDEIGTYIVTLGVGNANIVSTFTMEINLEDESYKGYFTGPTDISEKQTVISQLKVSPNPVIDVANISFKSEEKTSANILLLNIAGQTILNNNINLSTGHNSIEINTNNLEKGVYILQISTIKGLMQSYKIIK